MKWIQRATMALLAVLLLSQQMHIRDLQTRLGTPAAHLAWLQARPAPRLEDEPEARQAMLADLRQRLDETLGFSEIVGLLEWRGYVFAIVLHHVLPGLSEVRVFVYRWDGSGWTYHDSWHWYDISSQHRVDRRCAVWYTGG